MTAARRLAAILAADVGVREHRDGASENRANGSFLQAVTSVVTQGGSSGETVHRFGVIGG